MGLFKFNENYVLENSRAYLRPLEIEDMELFSSFSLNEPDLWKYSLIPANGLDNLKKYINTALQNKNKKDSYPFVIYDKRTYEVAGSSRFYDYQEKHNTAQLGYTWYGKEFQGTGLNKNVKYIMLEFAFETLELDRVEFRADANNQRSIAAMKSIGCTIEGVLRSNCSGTEGRRDSIVLSILKHEWYNSVKSMLSQKLV